MRISGYFGQFLGTFLLAGETLYMKDSSLLYHLLIQYFLKTK
jgi:hypothetical protein